MPRACAARCINQNNIAEACPSLDYPIRCLRSADVHDVCKGIVQQRWVADCCFAGQHRQREKVLIEPIIQKPIAPATPMQADEPAGALQELFAARELLFTWTRREFRVRYSQSFLGAAWAVLQPLTLMVIFSVVFGFVLQVETNGVPYPLFSYAGSLPWTFFASSLTFAIPSLVNNMNLVSKIYFPREILPLSSILVCLIDFLVGAVLLIPLLIIYRVEIGLYALLLPLIVLIQMMFAFGLTLILSAMNVFFRDVRFVIPLALQILLYLSPVIYPASQVPEALRPVYFLNPMAVLIESFRAVLIFNQPPDWLLLGLAALVSLVLLVVGYRYFKLAERRFADVI